MNDPRQPLEESQLAVVPASQRAGLTWSQRGGWLGCFDGRQSLGASFWILGVGLAVMLTVAGRVIVDAMPLDTFRIVTACTTLAIILTRILAWYSIVKCRHNTGSPLFTALALILVSLDIVFGVFRWPAMLAAMIMV